MEQAISFAATVCLETCRRQGRRLLLGWTGPTPGVRQGPASVKLLHELLEQLAVLRAASEGSLAELLDVLPPATLREALLIVVSTRPLNLVEEAERTPRLAGTAARGIAGRIAAQCRAGRPRPAVPAAESTGHEPDPGDGSARSRGASPPTASAAATSHPTISRPSPPSREEPAGPAVDERTAP